MVLQRNRDKILTQVCHLVRRDSAAMDSSVVPVCHAGQTLPCATLRPAVTVIPLQLLACRAGVVLASPGMATTVSVRLVLVYLSFLCLFQSIDSKMSALLDKKKK